MCMLGGTNQGPLIRTLDGGIDLIPAKSKDVCFGPTGCVADITKAIAEGVTGTRALSCMHAPPPHTHTHVMRLFVLF